MWLDTVGRVTGMAFRLSTYPKGCLSEQVTEENEGRNS